MVCKVGLNSLNGHWPNIYEDLWANLQDKANYKSPALGLGTDVKLCLSDGKISLHRSKLMKFTTLLDFSYEDLNNAMDPWGIVTLILPNFKMESAKALGRLIYCGDSGFLNNKVKKEISSVLRPKFRKALKMVHSKKNIEASMPMVIIEKDINPSDEVGIETSSNPKSQSKQSIAEPVTTIDIDENQEECRIVNYGKNFQEPDLVDLESENDDLVSEHCDLVIDEMDTNPMFIHQPLDSFNFKTLGMVTTEICFLLLFYH